MRNPSTTESRLSELEIASVRASNAVAAMQTMFSSLVTKIESMDGRFDALETRMDSMGGRFDALETRMDSMDTRIDLLAKNQEEGFADLRMSIAAVADETAGLKAWREEITPKIVKAVEHAENMGKHRH